MKNKCLNSINLATKELLWFAFFITSIKWNLLRPINQFELHSRKKIANIWRLYFSNGHKSKDEQDHITIYMDLIQGNKREQCKCTKSTNFVHFRRYNFPYKEKPISFFCIVTIAHFIIHLAFVKYFTNYVHNKNKSLNENDGLLKGYQWILKSISLPWHFNVNSFMYHDNFIECDTFWILI